ncbi:hypothetical protein BXY82_2650 [Gelidibacter sediminis]|uniref:Uncharacterized protein n=1 Tax=Gelidibacter sediminis TaxID=1608710 RepID=A0A4R7PZZ1_9FLAO|nr:hypothetical protein [Gelidibacter sediminis]TDU40598.1 hypothetical protein BXY82_2650 [Gelidibacter sediminis]
MKSFIYSIVFMLSMFGTTALGQSLSGKLTVEGWGKTTTLKSQEPVALFKNFRDGKHKILFRFKNISGNEGLVLFQMKTTITYNGKAIGSSSRNDWPWLPGDMYVPIEAFDLIPLLQKAANKNQGTLAPGNYEIQLEMKPVKINSESINTTFSFNVG